MALQLSTLRWFNFHNVGPSPCGRSSHAMASDGTRVLCLEFIQEAHGRMRFPSSTFLTQTATTRLRTQSTSSTRDMSPPTQMQPQHSTLSSDEEDVGEGPTKYHVKFTGPHSSSGECWTKSKAEADVLRAQIAAGLVSMDEDRVVGRLTEGMRAMIEAEMGSLQRNEKSSESVSV
ncbi:hypothetical protein BGY98DRAFT_1141375 [Russula aff. rugulosa BPL654]|nr:hypothetical protein BGY98DRAFT_1141375 [Russula aff. rugulosa BPL654]